MNTSPQIEEKLCRLADHLLKTRTRLISNWQQRAANDNQLSTLNTLSRKEFLDHIPHILDVLEQQLRTIHGSAPPGLSEEKAEKMEVHGLSRWQQGFSVTEVVRDWNHLRCAILDEISRAVEDDPDWLGDAFSESVNILADLIADGINESVAKFEEIRQAEARSHTLDLKDTIHRLQDLVDSQSRRHREAYHDLRGHLGILASLASSIKKSDDLENSLKRLFEPLEDGLSQSLKLLESVRLHTALEAGQETPEFCRFDLSETIENTLKPYEILAEEKGIEVQTNGPDTMHIESDPLNFARILQNLMHNALKFTDKGKLNIQWGLNGKKDHWIVRIQNTGTFTPNLNTLPIAKKMVAASRVNPKSRAESGIDTRNDHTLSCAKQPPTAEMLEERDPAHSGGEGIGLSIAKRLSDLIGGRLAIEASENGIGVSATLYLPVPQGVKYE